MNNFKVLNEIANNWQLEAKLEDNIKYYYDTEELNAILTGNKFYVIGRKGTGKSAISEHILKTSRSDVFSEKLSFKNFPFNELYNHANNSYTPPNQYITIWKYLIYSFICRQMIRNLNINTKIREELSKIYGNKPISSLARTFSDWTNREFGITVFGTGGSIKVGKQQINNDSIINWQEKTNLLEDVILEYIDDAKYYIIFDELDEDYREIQNEESHQLYSYLLTSLFKAVQDIKSIFKDSKHNIIPVIFLRDDIYKIIRDADKTKWGDFIVEIDWSIHKLKNLLAYRISKSINENVKPLSFEDAWNSIFSTQGVKVGTSGKNTIPSFEAITRNTQLRPRDFVKFIQECAKSSINNSMSLIFPETVKKVERNFSNYLKSEIIDEIYPILPDIDNIFQTISSLRKWNFSIQEFKNEYHTYLKKGTIKEPNFEYMLQTLFHFSVIGNQDKRRLDRHYFKYQNKDATINFNERLVVHRGLFKSLQIL